MPGPSTPGGAANIATARWYCQRAWRWRIRPSATNQAAAALNALDNPRIKDGAKDLERPALR
jgi:hypothetical protein